MPKIFSEDRLVNIPNKKEYLSKIGKSLQLYEKKTFFYLNSQSFYLFNRNPEFNSALNNADYIIADGFSVVFRMNKLTPSQITKVVFTYSFFEFLADFFVQNRTKIYFLGGADDVVNLAVEKVKIKFKDIQICGFHNGYFGINTDSENIIKEINNSEPEVVIVGMGMPRSEVWINKYKNKINANCIFSVGGFFDFAAGNVKVAPKWMYNSGIEWIYRLHQEPKRLFWRYLVVNPYFIYRFIFDYFRLKLKIT